MAINVVEDGQSCGYAYFNVYNRKNSASDKILAIAFSYIVEK